MGNHFIFHARRILIFGFLATLASCQLAPPVSVQRLEEHRDLCDQTGLDAIRLINDLKVTWAVPDSWEALPLSKNLLFSHQQWRSPTAATGVGVAHLDLPLPLPAQAIVWFAKNEYFRRARNTKGAHLIGEWTDGLGREWFEAENSRYHVCGYAITRGTQAWIVYSGWRLSRDPMPREIALAKRSLESVVPTN
jgi:hypothetical protein